MFIPHTDDDRSRMLQRIGVDSLDELFLDVPAAHRFPRLDLPSALTEIEIASELNQISQSNKTVQELISFLGAGAYHELGVDYIRVGIGGGSGCLTSANTGIHYPMASLISECYQIEKNRNYHTKIVADGGFRNYDDIIKALALGADYVMLGGVLNKSLESCSPVYFGKLIPLSENIQNICGITLNF